MAGFGTFTAAGGAALLGVEVSHQAVDFNPK